MFILEVSMNGLNFIVVCLDNEIYDYAYSQVNKLPYAAFDNHFASNRSENVDERINYYYELWLKMEEKRDRICFLLFSDCLVLEEYDFSEKLREKFEECIIVYYFRI